MMTLSLTTERRPREAHRELLGVDQLVLPDLLAGLHVEGEQPAVDRADVDVAVAQRDAARVGRVGLGGDQVLVELRDERPDHLAGRGVEREHAAVGAGVVEHAVGHERERLQAAGDAARRVHPGDLEVLDVRGVDLVERAVVPALVAAVVGQPVVRVLVGVLDPARIDREARPGVARDDRDDGDGDRRSQTTLHRLAFPGCLGCVDAVVISCRCLRWSGPVSLLSLFAVSGPPAATG